jgi:hypothetical protein
MNKFKVGDRVRTVSQCDGGYFDKMETGSIISIGNDEIPYYVQFDKGYAAYCANHEIELIESTPKPFPEIAQAIDDLNIHYLKGINTEIFNVIYNYFAQFQYEKTVEVFPEVGKEYEFSRHCDLWFRYELDGFKVGSHMFNKIRPIQPSRLEQLKAKHPNLSNDELIELLDILLTQMRNTK